MPLQVPHVPKRRKRLTMYALAFMATSRSQMAAMPRNPRLFVLWAIGKQMLEGGEGLQSVGARGGDDAIEGGAGVGSLDGVGVDPIAPSKCKRSDGIFRRIR